MMTSRDHGTRNTQHQNPAYAEYRAAEFSVRQEMKAIRHFRSYVLEFVIFSALGGFFEVSSQPGGISSLHAFLAPIVGPWSKTLFPPSVPLTAMEERWFPVWTVLFILVLLSSSVAAYRLKARWMRVVLRIFGYMVIAFWCLHGIKEVIIELT